MRRRCSEVLLLGLATTLGACANDQDSFVVDALWWINAVDAYPDNCAEQGIESVRLRVEPLSGDADRAPQSAVFDCALGQARMRVVRAEGTGFSLPTGTAYSYTLFALDAAGDVLHTARGRFEDVPQAGVVELPVIDIFAPLGDAASLSAEWQFEDEAPLAESCASRGVTDVALDVASASDPDFLDAVELIRAPCEQGIVVETWPILAMGEFWMRYVALDARGGTQQLGEPLEVSVPSTGLDVPLETWVFE